jgi:DNA-directed RNA polymerase subunit K/omega
MRRSRKESTVLEPVHRLLHNGAEESAGMQRDPFVSEAAREIAEGQSSVRSLPRKPIRP